MPSLSVCYGNDNHIKIDMGQRVGYPLVLYINKADTQAPLQWESWSANVLLARGDFLQSPCVRVEHLLTQQQWANLAQPARQLLKDVPAKDYVLLQAMLSSSAAMELATSNPLLFVLLVDYACLHNIDKTTFLRMVKRRRPHILGEMGLVDSASAVRILARTSVQLQPYQKINSVRRVMENPYLLAKLHHVPELSITAFQVLDKYSEWVWPGLLRMLHADKHDLGSSNILQLAKDCVRMGAEYRQLEAIQSVQTLEKIHDRLVANYNQKDRKRRLQELYSLYGDYPVAPLPGNGYIQPISSWQELVDEGITMKHCVASRHPLIAAGEEFIYRMHGTRRLTIAIKSTPYGYQLKEVKGNGNAQATTSELIIIHDWLTRNN